jgi:hypothetical protein
MYHLVAFNNEQISLGIIDCPGSRWLPAIFDISREGIEILNKNSTGYGEGAITALRWRGTSQSIKIGEWLVS